jgi:hypothetical protein
VNAARTQLTVHASSWGADAACVVERPSLVVSDLTLALYTLVDEPALSDPVHQPALVRQDDGLDSVAEPEPRTRAGWSRPARRRGLCPSTEARAAKICAEEERTRALRAMTRAAGGPRLIPRQLAPT